MKIKNTAQALACAAAAFLAALPVPATAGFNDKAPVNYTVDGATATGYFKVVIEAINGIVREVYPGSAATYKPGSPAGGVLNISNGQSDICFTASAPEIAYALDGKAPFKESLKGKFTFVMLLHNGLTVHNVMTKEWAERNGIKSFGDIAAKKPVMRLTVNQPANLQSTVSMYQTLFDVYGIKEAEVTKGGTVIRGNAATGFDALRDGKVDVFINGGFVPTAELTDVSRGRELEWIDGDPAKMKEAADRPHRAEERLSVPDQGRGDVHRVERSCRWRARARGDDLQAGEGDGRQPRPGARHPSFARGVHHRGGVPQPDASALPPGGCAVLSRDGDPEVSRPDEPPARDHRRDSARPAHGRCVVAGDCVFDRRRFPHHVSGPLRCRHSAPAGLDVPGAAVADLVRDDDVKRAS